MPPGVPMFESPHLPPIPPAPRWTTRHALATTLGVLALLTASYGLLLAETDVGLRLPVLAVRADGGHSSSLLLCLDEPNRLSDGQALNIEGGSADDPKTWRAVVLEQEAHWPFEAPCGQSVLVTIDPTAGRSADWPERPRRIIATIADDSALDLLIRRFTRRNHASTPPH